MSSPTAPGSPDRQPPENPVAGQARGGTSPRSERHQSGNPAADSSDRGQTEDRGGHAIGSPDRQISESPVAGPVRGEVSSRSERGQGGNPVAGSAERRQVEGPDGGRGGIGSVGREDSVAGPVRGEMSSRSERDRGGNPNAGSAERRQVEGPDGGQSGGGIGSPGRRSSEAAGVGQARGEVSLRSGRGQGGSSDDGSAERRLVRGGAVGGGARGQGENRVAAQASGGLAGARGAGTDGESGKRTYAPDFLTELFRNPLEAGYADAAARKAREGAPAGVRKWTNSSAAAVTMVALGFLLVVAYQQTVADAPAATKARAALVEQVQQRRADTDTLQTRADQLGSDVSALREKELGGAAVAELRDLESATGLSAVRGNGAKITLRDGPTSVNPVTGDRNTVAQVKDTDLQLATNALWSLGAEAIAINGQRLTATSTIRQAGEAILVDFRPVSTPYQVIAIGPDDLAKNFRDGYAGTFFEELASKYGMSFDSSDVHGVTLDAANELKLRVAQPSTAPPVPPDGANSPASVSPGATSKAAQPHGTASEGGR